MTARRRATLAALTACAVVTTLAVAAPAHAAPAAAGLPPGWQVLSQSTIAGDITGDGRVDRLDLVWNGRSDSRVCAVQLRAGQGGGVFAAPVLVRLPVANGLSGFCPDVGVVVTSAVRTQDRLAVSSSFGGGAVLVFDFADGRFTLQSRFRVTYQTNVIGTKDFDGDGNGDLYTLSGDGSTTFESRVSRGTGWNALYYAQSPSEPQFLDLDRDGGTDVLVNRTTYAEAPFLGSAVDVVNGRTGRVLTLASTQAADQVLVTGAFFDADFDNRMDIAVTREDASGQFVGRQVFLNRTRDGSWSFVPR